MVDFLCRVLLSCLISGFFWGARDAGAWPVAGKIARKSLLNPFLYRLTVRLRSPGAFSYEPGQWVFLSAGERQARAFSFSGSPSGLMKYGEAEFLITRKGALPGSRSSAENSLSEAIWQTESGAGVSMSPAMGYGLDLRTDRPLVFISKGSGIGPYLSWLNLALEKGETFDATLVYLEYEGSQAGILHDELDELAEKNPGFRWISFVRDSYSGSWEKVVRQISALPGIVPLAGNASYFICGSSGLRHSMGNELKRQGVTFERIHTGDF